jgi:FAD:protein FMN transferase
VESLFAIENGKTMNNNDCNYDLHRFECEAMACAWEFFIAGETYEYSHQAAWAAFEEVRRLEYELSRFISSSDVTRIRCAAPGEEIPIGIAAMDCLRLAQQVHRDTKGAFDVTLGNLLEERRDESGLIAAPDVSSTRFASRMSALQLNEEANCVRVLQSDVHLDFGAIGKGYALDESAKTLREWSIENALLHSGQSTFLALGEAEKSPWRIALRNPLDETPLVEIQLRDCAISGSGMVLHGQHIIDPHNGLAASGKIATWAIASSAALSDALSTAFMVMSCDEIANYCRAHSDIAALVLNEDGSLVQFGVHAGFAIM